MGTGPCAKASSLALVSFGLDSTVEVLSALAIVWHLRGAMTKHREQRALKLIAISFFILAVYVCIQSLFDIFGNRQPETSIPGLVIGIASLIIMPFLAIAKRRIGKLMSSVTVKSDAQQTILCTYLSAILIVGLVLNMTLGWWWADPIAAIGIAILAFREGIQAWQS